MTSQYKILNSQFDGTDTTQLDDFAKSVELWLNGGWIANVTPPLASRCACPAIFTERSHFDAHSGTPFGTVWNRLGIDRRNLPVWVPIQRFYGGRSCDIQPAGKLGRYGESSLESLLAWNR
jgi:hypothetical protein